MNWEIPRMGSEPLQICLEVGERMFVVGPNGSGKSALIQHLVSKHKGSDIRRISAHRQTWLDSGSLDLTPQARREFGQDSIEQERSYEARWKDYNSERRQLAVLFDLVAKENERARSIAELVDTNQTKEARELAAKSVSVFSQVNDLLSLGTFLVKLRNHNDEEILAQHRDVDAAYSIAQMSDGERNAAIIGATVITVEPGTIMLIDEPERHLHRSIIVPFLAALFAHRSDCTFIISTHELSLPAANPAAGVLMVRSCEWENDRAKAWDIDLLASNAHLPEELRLAILGSRRRILFFEGTPTSLDLPLYDALFPDISAVPSGTSIDVQRAVAGMRASRDLHHVETYGLIDRDGRPPEVVDALVEHGVFALDVWAVESLYYCSDSLEAVAAWQETSLERSAVTMMELALLAAFDALAEDGLAERMAARRCEQLVRNRVMSQIPDWKAIGNHRNPNLQISVESPFEEELATFHQLLGARNLDGLIARYPVRDTRVFSDMASALEFKSKDLYGQCLVARVRQDPRLAEKLKQRVGPLSVVLSSGPHGS